MNIMLSLQKKSNHTYNKVYSSIKLESTRLFLIKNNNSNKLKYEENILYYNSNILLDEVKIFNIQYSTISTINICINDVEKVCQEWKIKFK